METKVRYDFRIDALTPETLPMARLAEYLAPLATLFGHKEHVHFVKVRKGSAVPEIEVDRQAEPKVSARLRLVGTPEAPPDARRAEREINDLLRSDGASATLRHKRGATVIAFPGCRMPLAREAIVHEFGELDGVVIRVGGKDDSVPVWLESEGRVVYKCNATRDIARDLGAWLFGAPVRLAGRGKWRRSGNRVWELDHFDIKSFEPLETVGLAESIERLRAVGGSDWNAMDDPQQALRRLRIE